MTSINRLTAARRAGRGHSLTMVDAGVEPVSIRVFGPLLGHHPELEIDEWADALQGAIDRGEIDVVYQPKVRLADGHPVGFEALARWTHPSRGAIGPDRFIPMADTTRLIDCLT